MRSRTVEGCGIEGDRYCEGTGFWTRYGDVCQVTLIEGEDLDYIEDELGIGVKERPAPAQHHHARHKASWTCAGRGSASARPPRVRPSAPALQARAGPERARHDAGPQEPGRHLRAGRQGRPHPGPATPSKQSNARSENGADGSRSTRSGPVPTRPEDRDWWGSGPGNRSREQASRRGTSSRSKRGS